MHDSLRSLCMAPFLTHHSSHAVRHFVPIGGQYADEPHRWCLLR